MNHPNYDISAAMRRKFSLPSGWIAHSVNASPRGLNVRGAVCPPKLSGSDKGGACWIRRDRATDFKGFISFVDLAGFGDG